MRLGAAAAAPEAFLDFCRRQPAECGLAPDSAAVALTKVAADQTDVTRDAWRRAFGVKSGEAADADWAPATAAIGPAPAATGSYDWAKAFAAAKSAEVSIDAPKAELAFAKEAIAKEKGAASVNAPFAPPASYQEMTVQSWAQLNKVNARINRALVQKTDAQMGAEDYWDMPLHAGKTYGDCEDYVLEKRAALVAEGWPPSTLSIGVVQTTWGEGHAVLIVATDKGDYVLDNRSAWIVPWNKTAYQWRARQRAGDAFKWALVASLD